MLSFWHTKDGTKCIPHCLTSRTAGPMATSWLTFIRSITADTTQKMPHSSTLSLIEKRKALKKQLTATLKLVCLFKWLQTTPKQMQKIKFVLKVFTVCALFLVVLCVIFEEVVFVLCRGYFDVAMIICLCCCCWWCW